MAFQLTVHRSIKGSTAEAFWHNRELNGRNYDDLDTMLGALEDGELDAVVFDSPILAYYVLTGGAKFGQLVGPTFQH